MHREFSITHDLFSLCLGWPVALFALFPSRFSFMLKYVFAHEIMSHAKVIYYDCLRRKHFEDIYLAYRLFSTDLEVSGRDGKRTQMRRGWVTHQESRD